MIGGIPGYMPPPMQGPVNDQVGSTTPPKAGGSSTSSTGLNPIFNFHFNPGGGVGNPFQGTSGGLMSTPTPQGGPTNIGRGGGPGWMPPPPIGGIGDGGGGIRPSPFRMPPVRMPPVLTYPPTQQPPNFFPPNDPRGSAMPGWAGYLQWLQQMGGRGPGIMPPPPIGGI